ncbi:hypothetical protein BKA66DRAFT_613719 [Pyrenochaeta sp. MPI-SDFR-AT-0127]|nr:hypothetical protein BKA66DRAFT_613719 [Pyrenochaeta sp. MPI-SDFR-AT-0127]
MPDPVIKKEESPEPRATAFPDDPTLVSTLSSSTTLVSSKSCMENLKLSTRKPCIVTSHAPIAPHAYHGSSPHRYKLRSSHRSRGPVSALTPLVSPCLPTRATSAVATGGVNKSTTKATTTSTIPTLNCLKNLLDQHKQRTKNDPHDMEEHRFGGGEEMDLPVLSPMITMQVQKDALPVPSQGDLENLRKQLKSLQDATDVSEKNVSGQGTVISELITFNHNVHAMVQQLETRMAKVEYDNIYFRSMLTSASNLVANKAQSTNATRSSLDCSDVDEGSKSPSPAQREHRGRGVQGKGEDILKGTVVGRINKTRARKKLQITIPEKTSVQPPVAGLPTPLSRNATTLSVGTSGLPSNLPKTPITPGRIGPNNLNKRSSTSIFKRQIHNLDKVMPPANVQIPLVPLTDTEIIVYFFQSLSRPVVALRLYSRNWGPASIVEVLNDHREIEPPYLRNTCSVKCTTSIKKGKEKFGGNWEDSHREVFDKADDVKATDLIRLTDEELDCAVNYDVRNLCIGLKKHPQEDVDGGIFTRCVKYCQENDAAYTIFDVWELAADLQQGRRPEHPPSPTTPAYFGRDQQDQLCGGYGIEDTNGVLETHTAFGNNKIATSRHIRTNSTVSAHSRLDSPDSVIGDRIGGYADRKANELLRSGS